MDIATCLAGVEKTQALLAEFSGPKMVSAQVRLLAKVDTPEMQAMFDKDEIRCLRFAMSGMCFLGMTHLAGYDLALRDRNSRSER